MRLVPNIAAILSGLVALPAVAVAATISSYYYATQYDYRDFFAATDGKQFQVVLAGNAFPGVDPETVARALLPAMQAAKPRPALTFTYAKPSPPPSPDYRLVLVFDPANDLNAYPVCAENNVRFRRAGRASSMSTRSTVGTSRRCRTQRRGQPRPARPIRASSNCSASCSWSSSATSTSAMDR